MAQKLLSQLPFLPPLRNLARIFYGKFKRFPPTAAGWGQSSFSTSNLVRDNVRLVGAHATPTVVPQCRLSVALK